MATPIDDDTLQRFYDGDLSPLEEHRVQARIEADPAAQRRLVELGLLTDLMREGTDELANSVHSSGLFAAIEAQLDREAELGLGTRMRVMASEWFEHRRASLVQLTAATAVAAISLMAVIRPATFGIPSTTEKPIIASHDSTGEHTTTPASEPGAEVIAVHGSQVENVDFGASTGTVFEIDNAGVAVAVVWITDDEETP